MVEKYYTLRIKVSEMDELVANLPEHLQKLLNNKVAKVLSKRLKVKNEHKRLPRKEWLKNKKERKEQRVFELATKRREELIQRQTESEKIFKAKLKALRVLYEFQKIVYTKESFYILDFYLPYKDLIIEIDGGYHKTDEQRIKDKARTEELAKQGYKNIKRFTNEEAIKITDLDLKPLVVGK